MLSLLDEVTGAVRELLASMGMTVAVLSKAVRSH